MTPESYNWPTAAEMAAEAWGSPESIKEIQNTAENLQENIKTETQKTLDNTNNEFDWMDPNDPSTWNKVISKVKTSPDVNSSTERLYNTTDWNILYNEAWDYFKDNWDWSVTNLNTWQVSYNDWAWNYYNQDSFSKNQWKVNPQKVQFGSAMKNKVQFGSAMNNKVQFNKYAKK